MDTIWYHISKMKSLVGNNDRFSLLFKCVLVVLLTPHSNTSIERVFSLVNKKKSEDSDRNRLDIEGSLLSILAVKKAAVNYKKRVTGQSSKVQQFYLGCFLWRSFERKRKSLDSLKFIQRISVPSLQLIRKNTV